MGKHLVLLITAIITFSTPYIYADWREDLDSLFITDSPELAGKYIENILGAGVAWDGIISRIDSLIFPEKPSGVLILDHVLCRDSVERPYLVYVPPNYDSRLPTPLLVVLHGGVARAELIDDPKKYAETHPFSLMAQENGWLVLYPFGQSGATWFDEVGMANIKNQVRIVKSRYNVDDDRVWMGGFSNGASASFAYAMLDQSDYGAFVALNGHMGVASQDGGTSTFPTNFFSSPVYAVATFRDALYPSSQMRKGIEMARKAGADIFYKERDGVHDFDYAEEGLPLIADYLNRHPRDPHPPKIVWESTDRRFGRCFWLAIDSVSGDQPQAEWHKSYNVEIIDSSITIGFYPDETSSGPGVLVGGIAGEEYLAGKMGLSPGDIIMAGNGIAIDKTGNLNTFKSALHYGDIVEIDVIRNGKKTELRGDLPDPRVGPLLMYHDVSSALVRAIFYGNTVEIESSRLKSFRILISPDMFNIDQNLRVIVDGRVVYDKQIVPNPEFMLWNFWENLDRRLLYIFEIGISL